jgi:hypothetical protein
MLRVASLVKKYREPIITSLIIGFVVCFILSVVTVIKLASNTPKSQIVISNMHPCLPQDNAWISIDGFGAHGTKYICADMQTDHPPAELTLIIEPINDPFRGYAYDASFDFKEGSVSFLIRDKLPPGVYRARILYARDTLANINFDVSEK